MQKRSIDPKIAANFLERNHKACMQYLNSESVLQTLSVVLYDAHLHGYCPDIIDTSQSVGRMPMKTESQYAPCITSWPWIDVLRVQRVCSS